MADRVSGEWQLFNLRLPLHAMERIHRYRDHLNATQPGIEANVSMAARMLRCAHSTRWKRKWGSKGSRRRTYMVREA